MQTNENAGTIRFLGEELASVLNIRPQTISIAVKKDFKSRGYPVAEWAVRQEGGQRLAGFDVPTGIAEELLPAPVWEKLQAEGEASLSDVVEPGRKRDDITDELKLLAERGDQKALQALREVLVRTAAAMQSCAETAQASSYKEARLTADEATETLTTCSTHLSACLPGAEALDEKAIDEKAIDEEIPGGKTPKERS